MKLANHSYRTLLLLALFAAAPLWGQHRESAELKDFAAAEIAFNERTADVEVTIEAFEQRFVFDLVPNEALWARLPDARRDRALDDGRNAFYRGGLTTNPGSWARINRVQGVVTGMFSDGEHLYLVDKAEGFKLPAGRTVEADATIVFRLSDLEARWRFDAGGADHHHDGGHDSELSTEWFPERLATQPSVRSADYLVPVTIVSDVEFTNEHGNDTEAVVLGRMNLIDGFYSGQVGTGILLWHHEVLDDNGSLTSPSVGDFREFMDSGDGSGIPFEGQAHLFTGRDIEGAAGQAFLDVTCNTFSGVGVNEDLSNDTISALIVTHELGHNFGARHDDDTDSCPEGTPEGIMASTIGPNNNEFSQCSLDAMVPNLTSASCLQPSPGFVFQDRFQSPD